MNVRLWISSLKRSTILARSERVVDWYQQLAYELTNVVFSVVHDDPQLKAWHHQVYSLASELLKRGEIPLANDGPDLDAERKPHDTLVLHHTEEDPQISLAKLTLSIYCQRAHPRPPRNPPRTHLSRRAFSHYLEGTASARYHRVIISRTASDLPLKDVRIALPGKHSSDPVGAEKIYY